VVRKRGGEDREMCTGKRADEERKTHMTIGSTVMYVTTDLYILLARHVRKAGELNRWMDRYRRYRSEKLYYHVYYYIVYK
jgi:hypothetical protein